MSIEGAWLREPGVLPEGDIDRVAGNYTRRVEPTASGSSRYTRWCLILVMLYLGPMAQAAMRVPDLYEVEVAVADKSTGERTRAMTAAFMEVMVRVSGLSKIMQYQEISEAVKRTSHYVQQYRYEKVSRRTPPGSTELTEALTLKVRFNENIINQMLRQNRLPVWGVARPATLVWVAVDDQGERYLLGGDRGVQVIDSLNLQARRRGLPLLYPLLDLEDQARISFVDVWGGFADAIRAASERYDVEAIATARLYRDSTGAWKARWMMFSAGDEQQWTADAAEMDTLLAQAADSIADILAAQYAIYSDALKQSGVTLAVYGVRNLDDYARVNGYLQSSNSVASAQLRQVNADHVLYDLEIRGDVTSMERSFALDNILAPDKSAAMVAVPRDGAPLSGDGTPLPGAGAPLSKDVMPLIKDAAPVVDITIDALQAAVIQLNYRLVP